VWGDRNLYGAGNPREDDRDRRNDRVMSMVPARQLHLFKVSASAESGRTARPSGEKRDQANAARLKGTDVVGGFPDLMFFGIKGEVCCVELNAEGGRLSES
jgi:hypothetical protein